MTRLIIPDVFFKVFSGGVRGVFPFLDGLFRSLDGFLPLFAEEIGLIFIDDRNGRNDQLVVVHVETDKVAILDVEGLAYFGRDSELPVTHHFADRHDHLLGFLSKKSIS